jgi:hypothetical protein
MPFEYHPAALASDTTDYQAGTLNRISSAISKGAPAAAISGALSIYNSFLFEEHEVDIQDAVTRFGGEGMGDYYTENKSAIDIVGFIGTSLIPGSIGVKGLKMARSGLPAGNFSKFLNLAPSRKKQFLDAALQETAQAGGTIKGIMSRNRLKYLGWEAADAVMVGTAAELGVAAMMHDSPVFDGDTIGDLGWNIALGAGLSGVIGGAVGSIMAKGILKSAQSEIQTAAREYDVLADAQKLGLSRGTDSLVMAESLLDMPSAFAKVPFKYKLDGAVQELEGGLQTEEAFKRIRMDAQKLGQDKLAMKFNDLALGDERIGQAYFRFMQEGMEASKAAGLDATEAVQKLHGYLANLSHINALNLEQLALDSRKFYVSAKPVGDTPLERATGLFSKTRTKETQKAAYRLADDVTEQDIVIQRIDDLGEVSLKDAFKRNPDVDAIQLLDGSVRINPRSSKVLRVRENPLQVKQLIDLETGALTNETAAVIGDILQKGKLAVQADGVYINGQRYAQVPSKAATMADSPLESSARWVWASQLDASMFKKATQQAVDLADFPAVTRLAELVEQGKLTDAQMRAFRLTDDGVDVDWEDIADLRAAIDEKRLTWLEGEYANWSEAMGSVPDTRVLAAHLNTDYKWIEETIERGYARPTHGEQQAGTVLDTAAAMNPRTVQATWDFGWTPHMLPEEAFKMNMGPSHLVTQELTKEYQRTIRRSVNEETAAAVLGQDAAQFMPADRLLAKETSVGGAGATLLGAANAGYGERAKLWVQNTGKSVAQATLRRTDETMQTLVPWVNGLRTNQAAAAELGVVTNMLRMSKHRYSFHPLAPADGITGEVGHILVAQDAFALAKKLKISLDDAIARMPVDPKHPASITIRRSETAGFLRTSADINHFRQGKFTSLYNAAGLARKLPELPVVYAPPINTVKYPFHAFVKTKPRMGLATDVGMITAKSEESLRAQAASLGDDFDIFYKQDTENYFKIKGEYDYSLSMNESAVNSELARRGKLADMLPETRFENINEDWLQWHSRQEEKLVREAVQVQNREFFSEMRLLSEQYRKVSESVSRGIGSRFKSKVADPFGDYIKTALNISKQQEFPLLDSLNEFVDKLGLAAGDAVNKGLRDASKGIISWEDANRIMADKGLGTMYRNPEQYIAANERMPKNLVKTAFQKVNMALATTMLRLDFANSLVNMISTPIMLGTELASIKRMIANDDKLAGALRELTTLPLPGNATVRVPSTTKLIGNAINNFFGADKNALIARYKGMGAMKSVADQYHQLLDMAAHDPRVPMTEFAKRADKVVELGTKISGNTFSEDFTRFVSADVMKQLSDPLVRAGKLTVKEQDAYISTFVNRVQGNYVTSQRPVIFQGTTGAAISLFQTYAFNVLQQLHRHMEVGDKRTLAIFAGLQGSIFGMNGLPFFDAVNTHLIGGMIAQNPEHKDAYSVLPAFNKDLGDWLLYGTASAFPLMTGSTPAFFTRGDINPRHALILPTAIADVPAVSASIKLVNTLLDMGKNISGGADLDDALLKGLQHQGWNRPLAGFAQLLGGQSVDNKGALISAAVDLQTTSKLAALAERTFSLEGATRLMGARPMDEAVALNAMYRNKSYEAMDRARIERLGAIVKTKLYNNSLPEQEELDDFMLRYTRSGGRIENFNQAMQRWSRDANVSIVNQLADRMGNPYSRKLQTIMGGEPIDDYRNAGVPAYGQTGQEGEY